MFEPNRGPQAIRAERLLRSEGQSLIRTFFGCSMSQRGRKRPFSKRASVGLGVAFRSIPCQIWQRDLCIAGIWPARTSVDGRVFMGPAESYFGRASLPAALVRRCDLSHSVSSCSLHEVLEVVQLVHRHRVAARLALCSFPFYGRRIWGAFLPFRIFRIGCCFEYFDL